MNYQYGGLPPQVMQQMMQNAGYQYGQGIVNVPGYGPAYQGNMLDGRARAQAQAAMPPQMRNAPVSNPGNYVDWNKQNAITTRQMQEAQAREQANSAKQKQWLAASQPKQPTVSARERDVLDGNRQAMQAQAQQQAQQAFYSNQPRTVASANAIAADPFYSQLQQWGLSPNQSRMGPQSTPVQNAFQSWGPYGGFADRGARNVPMQQMNQWSQGSAPTGFWAGM